MTNFGSHFRGSSYFQGEWANFSLLFGGFTKDLMTSSRDNNAAGNVGSELLGKKGLAHFIQKKISRHRTEPTVVKSDGSPHLLRNGGSGAFTDYTAPKKHDNDSRKILPGDEESSRSTPAMQYGEAQRTPPTGKQAKQGARLAHEVLKGDGRGTRRRPDDIGGGAAVAGAGLGSVEKCTDDESHDLRRALILDSLLHELPGLDIGKFDMQNGQRIKPEQNRIKECKERYKDRSDSLKGDLEEHKRLKDPNPKLIADLEAEIAHCRECTAVLERALKKSKSNKNARSSFWQANLLDRWRERYPAVDLLARVRALRDLDKVVAEQHEEREPDFVFLPQELCWLEMEIAAAELLDIQKSTVDVLTAEQLVQLIQAIACGWPGVAEDSQSDRPERRANAAGCVRALAQLANKGQLPREVLASFPNHDAINRALLIRGQKKEMGDKYRELIDAKAALQELEIEIDQRGQQASGDKGKEHEDEVSLDDLKHRRDAVNGRITALQDEVGQVIEDFNLDPDAVRPTLQVREKMKEAGRKLGELYAELMVAERNLRAAGVNIRRVRVDEYFVKGMLKKQPGKREAVALMLARVALIEEEIAKLNPNFQRRNPNLDSLSYGDTRDRTREPMAEHGLNPRKGEYKPPNRPRQWPLWMTNLRVGANPTVFADGLEIDEPRNPLGKLKVRHRKNSLLRYGITEEDAVKMSLPSIVDEGDRRDDVRRDKEAIRNLANANVMSPDDVAFMHASQQQVRDHLIDTAAGRKAMRSAFGMTTAQLSAEYLDMVFRWVTGEKNNFNLGYRSPEVCQAMADRWRKVRKLSAAKRKSIAQASSTIRKKRVEVLESIGDPDRLGTVEGAHKDSLEAINAIRQTLGQRRYHLLATMIRAAILAARPQVLAGDKPGFEPIDTYDASRYRDHIIAILQSWGMEDDDTDFYEPIIDHFVFSRAEDSAKAPGTVTAKRLARWQRLFRNGIPPADAAMPDEPADTEPPSRMERARKSANKALKAVAGFVSDKEVKELDPEFVERIIASIPAISNYGKISIRTNLMVNGAFPFDTAHGFAIPVSLGGGRQVGLIIKRVNSRLEVRLVAGFVLTGQIGITANSDDAVSGEGGAKLDGSWYQTEGISAHFPITYNPKTGREDFSAAQAYLRSLLVGELPSTEFAAKNMFNFQRIEKSGQHVKPIGSASISYGGHSKLPEIGLEVGMAATETTALDHRWRWRQGRQKNADAQADKRISKFTSNTTLSTGADLGLKLGYRQAVGAQISDLGAPIAKDQLLGVSAGKYWINLKNRAVYDVGRSYDWDWVTNIGPVDSVEAALDKCGDAKKRINELLDRETTLQNGDKIKFGAAIEQALKLLRANDGFLLQWVPKPEAEALVNRHFNRIAQIKEQILPTLDTWYIRKQIARKNRLLAATRLRNPEQLDREMIRKDIEKLKKQQRELDGQRRDVMDELATLSAAIATRKDPSNLNYFDLEAVYIMPIVMQTDTKTVLNLAGLLNVSHVGTRMHDTIVACIPAPKPDFGRAVAEKALDHDNDLHEKVAPSDRNAAERGLLARSPNEETTSEKGLEEVVYIRRALWRSPISDDDGDRVDSDGSDIGSSTEQVSETPPRRRLGPFRSTGEELVALDESPSIKRTPFKELGEARIERLARIRASSGQGDTSE